jgi:hypothetical protein
VGPDDYFVEMETRQFIFIWGTLKGQNFVLRKIATGTGMPTLEAETIGPAGDDYLYHVNAYADRNGFTLAYVTPQFACTPIYKIHFTRFSFGSAQPSSSTAR